MPLSIAPAAGRTDVFVCTGNSLPFERRRSLPSPGFHLETALLATATLQGSRALSGESEAPLQARLWDSAGPWTGLGDRWVPVAS